VRERERERKRKRKREREREISTNEKIFSDVNCSIEASKKMILIIN
jgi:hypothetical protein